MPSVVRSLSVVLAILAGGVQDPRPVRDVTPPPIVEDLEFGAVSLQLPGIYHGLTAHFRPVDGEPTAGVRYGIEASIGGQRFIATASFELLDDAGTLIEQIPMVAESSGSSEYDFVGMLTVPGHPFRIRMRGTSVDGQRFRGVYPRLFRPVRTPPPALQFGDDDGMPKEMLAQLKQRYEHMMADALIKREPMVAANSGGRIVLPRRRISNVMFAPYLSPSGRPLGMRLTYEAEFDTPGRYGPSVHAYQEHSSEWLRGSHTLRALHSTIAPVPRLVHAPAEPAVFERGSPGQWTDYLYDARVRYTCTVDLVPDYVTVMKKDGPPCLRQDRHQRDAREKEAWALRLASRAPAVYRISIGVDAFEGRIDDFPSEGSLYQQWLDEGTPPCPLL